MSSPKKRSEGAKPDLAPLAHPMPNEIVDSTPDRSTELAIASHPAAARDEISQRNADSPLLRLPAEPRNNIFALALTQGDIKWNYGAWLKNKNSVNLLYKIKQAERRGFEYRYHYKRFCNIFYNPISFSARSCSFKLKKRPVRNSKRLNHLKRPVNLLFREVMEKVWSTLMYTSFDPFLFSSTTLNFKSSSTNFTAISKDVGNDMSALDEQSESDHDQISQQNAKSPLLRLPAELRNQIFALALIQPTIEIFWSEPHLKFRFHEDCRPDYVRQPLNLLFVCRQTHAETATLPYKLNIFAVDFVYQRDPPKNFLYQRTVEQREVMGSVSERNPNTGKAGKPMSATRWMASMEAEAFVLYTWKRGEMEA
ncbi:hypothetical protein J4E81_003455 [Alternaria sp. BMP 2799]|nr:hypothetical protein J4E81_003455 [Alternaria sp. BMP 2799]